MRAIPFVLALLVAGCASPAVEAPDETLADVEADVDDERGAVRGVIVDAAIRPVPFATVRLGEQERVTGENGTFRFSLVPPGNHRIAITAEGFQAITQDVAVLPAAISDVRVALEVDMTTQPYHEIFPFKGFFEAAAGPATGTLWDAAEAAGTAPCTCTFDIPVDERPAAIIVEVFWEDQIYTNNVRHTEYTAHLSWSGGAASTTQANPLHWFIAGEALGDDAWLTLSILPDESIPTAQQEFTVFATPFYIEAPAENWRFAIDG